MSTVQPAGGIATLAHHYIALVHSVDLLFPGYIDACYGPAKQSAQHLSNEEICHQASELCRQIKHALSIHNDSAQKQRLTFLLAQTAAIPAYMQWQLGQPLRFDAESLALYGIVSDEIDETKLVAQVSQLDARLTGRGSLAARLARWRQDYIVPQARMATVLSCALEHVRALCLQQLAQVDMRLPRHEAFRIEMVAGKVWTAYNWYQGDYQSVIQFNTDMPLYLDRVIELVSHEGYPGHHLFNVLQEQGLVNGNGWPEYAIYPLFSPISSLAEASADLGLSLLMSESTRQAFEAERLQPLAGIDGDWHEYCQIKALLEPLKFADNLVARQWLEGDISASEAMDKLIYLCLNTPARAQQRLAFFETNRSYIVNYHSGCQQLHGYLLGQGRRYQQHFYQLLQRPLLAQQWR
ncbi:hypothetical protein [Shewanella sp. NIFS-20-20]|uniref:hypothetical protein n=1 Tax=Shewanella sp. NIFS-20-20 TaxID=2853806 RepID=UPI001C48F83A|nr:hypothetical protein [Shewanella sp. NIFS-20-20]MBV7316672.1 hypothetical protein [Shewanella sp. NIFS-20-20]